MALYLPALAPPRAPAGWRRARLRLPTALRAPLSRGWLGFVWCLVFAALAPASSPGASAGKGAAREELGLISAVDGSGSPRCSASAPRCARPSFLAHPAFLAVCAAHFANNWGAYLLLSWLPKYLISLGATVTASRAAPLPPPAAGSPR